MPVPRYLPSFESHTLSTKLNFLRALRRKYKPLYGEKIRQLPDGSKAFQHARLFEREGFRVLHLKGDSFELAFQHGKLLSEEVKSGVLMQLSRTIPNLLENSVSRSPLLNRMVMGLVDFMGKNLRSHIPSEYLTESFALSEGSGLALHHISNALLAMEGLYILAKYAVKSKDFDLSPMAFAGCSSFAAWGKRTREGELVIGRNLDYPLNGYFDAFPTVMYIEPTDHGQKYMTIGSAGLFTPSLTAMNASGIYLAGHIVPTEETSFHGTPMYFVASEVIRNATTFDEAVDLFRQHRTTVGWAYVLVSTKEKRVASVEMTNDRVAVRESHDECHFQTNHFSLIESSNLYVNRSVEEDTMGRYRRMEEQVREARGSIGPAQAATLLGDAFDPIEGRVRGLGNTVAVHITVGSAVFLPDRERMFLAKGTAPTSWNDFVEFPDIASFDPDRFASEPYETLKTAAACPSPGVAEAVKEYIKAKMAYEYDSDLVTASECMKKVLALDPDNAAYRFVAAILHLKQEQWEDAVKGLSQVLACDHTHQLHCLSYYYLGRIYAHHRQPKEAINAFENVLSSECADEKLKKAALKAKNICRIFGRFHFRTDRLPLMMQFADMVSY